MTEGQRRASWSEPYYQVLLHIDAEKQLAIMTKKFNMAKQGRDKFRKENEELKKENEELKMNTHRLNCSHCNLISSEDDIFLSIDCGEFTCEGCFNEGKSKNIKKENEELEQQISDITDALWDEAVPVPRTDLILSDIHKGRQAIEENQELFQELENMKKKYICIPGEYLMDN
tara:strand:- start:728 stop:1246 length:519 start_codon:yes stop_codon:yes gene_type:complete